MVPTLMAEDSEDDQEMFILATGFEDKTSLVAVCTFDHHDGASNTTIGRLRQRS